MNRRNLIAGLGTATVVASTDFLSGSKRALAQSTTNEKPSTVEGKTRDEELWSVVTKSFIAPKDILNLNGAGVSPQPTSVQQSLIDDYFFANELPSFHMWEKLDSGRDHIKSKLAKLADCTPEEIALNRNATEGLCTAIHGIDLRPKDEVLVCKWDYFSMRYAWQQREAREGIHLKWVDFDLNDDNETIVQRYKEKMSTSTRVVHLTHVVHYTGRILPVEAICQVAREKGIQTIVDAAQSFAHIPTSFNNMACDYFATSLHKWLCAPFGSGMLIVRKDRIPTLWPLLAPFNPDEQKNTIDKIDGWALGTYDSAREEAVDDAIDFHNAIGSELKYRRLQYLKRYWTREAIKIDGLKFNVSLDDSESSSFVHMSLKNLDGRNLTERLMNDYRILVTARIYEGLNGIRISPHIYTSTSQLDRLLDALRDISTRV